MGLQPQDIRVGAEYEAARVEARAAAVETRRRRRVELGDLLSLVFETRDTLRAAAEEMIRAERIDTPEQIAAEVAAFNELVPGAGGLAASLYLEVSDAAELSGLLAELEGLTAAVYLELDGSRIGARVDSLGGDTALGPATYLSFALAKEQRQAWRDGAKVTVGVNHSRCRVAVELTREQRQAVAEDLSGWPAP